MPSEFQSYSEYPPIPSDFQFNEPPPPAPPFALGIPKRRLWYGMDIFWKYIAHYPQYLLLSIMLCKTQNGQTYHVTLQIALKKVFAVGLYDRISKERVLNNSLT